MLRKLSAIRSQSRPHRNWSLIMYVYGKLDLGFPIFSLGNAEIESRNICGVEGTRLNRNLYKSKAENAEKSGNHEFWRKMFCLVAITYTSPKVSVTANKRVPRKKKNRV